MMERLGRKGSVAARLNRFTESGCLDNAIETDPHRVPGVAAQGTKNKVLSGLRRDEELSAVLTAQSRSSSRRSVWLTRAVIVSALGNE